MKKISTPERRMKSLVYRVIPEHAYYEQAAVNSSVVYSFFLVVPLGWFPELLQKVAALEISVRVNDSIEVGLIPRSVFLDFLDLRLVRPLEDSVAGDMIASLLDILFYAAENILVVYSGGLKEYDQIVHRKVSVWTAMGLANTGSRLAQDLLTRIGRIPSASAVGISTHITVSVADIVLVSGVELIVRKALERLTPEDDTLFQ